MAYSGVADITGGLRQSLLNVLTQIDEVNTAMVSNLKTSQAIQPTHSWVSDRVTLPTSVDSVAAPANLIVAPSTITTNSTTTMVQSSNYCQIVRTSFALTNEAIASHYAGIGDLVQYFKSKTLKYVANGLEMSICQGVLSTGNGSSVGNEMAGLIAWGTAANGYITNGSTAAATLATSTGEDAFSALLAAMWAKGVRPDFAYMSPTNKAKVDKWTNNVVRNLFIENKENKDIFLPAMISVYQSSFGVVRLFFSTAMTDTSIVPGVMDELAIAYLTDRLPKVIPLGVQYDGFGYLTVLEATLEVRDPFSVNVLTLT
jgi:hypothetical protein